jgi:threonine 3-dehydrogenase
MTRTFVAVRKTASRPGAELVEVPLPETLGPEEVLVRVDLAAICASDVHVYDWRPDIAALGLDIPFTMGHEFTGEVVRTGAQVKGLAEGDRVSGETHLPCGKCYQCQTGEQHRCRQMGILGRSVDGCMAEYIVLPRICARKISPDIPVEQAALMEPLGVAVHAVDKADVSGEILVIMGCGAIGLMAIGVAKAFGALRVYATSRTPAKLERALQMGAHRALKADRDDVVGEILAATDQEGVGRVIDFTGNAEAIRQGFQILRKGGTYVGVGIPRGPVELDLVNSVIYREAVYTGIHGREMWKTWIQAERLLSWGLIDLSPVTGRRFPLTEFEAGFEEASAPIPGRVLLDPKSV